MRNSVITGWFTNNLHIIIFFLTRTHKIVRLRVCGFTENGLHWNISQLWKLILYNVIKILEISFGNYVSSLLSMHYSDFLFTDQFILLKPRALNPAQKFILTKRIDILFTFKKGFLKSQSLNQKDLF